MVLLTVLGRILSPSTWIFVCVLYITGVLGYGICCAIQTVAGGTADGLNKAAHFFHVHNSKLEAVAGLYDGSCSHYEHLSTLFYYLFEKMIGVPTCQQMAWYETITLTRLFVAYPLHLVGCIGGLQNDLCAGVVGGKALGQFIFEKGVWMFLGFYLLSPVAFALLTFLKHQLKKIKRKVVHLVRTLVSS